MTLEQKLQRFIQNHPVTTLNDLTHQFSSSSQLELLSALVLLEEGGVIACTQTSEDRLLFRSLVKPGEALLQASHDLVRTVASRTAQFGRTITGIQFRQKLKRQARIEVLGVLLEHEFEAYKCSHYKVEILMLQGVSLAEISDETGYSEVWLRQLAKRFNVPVVEKPRTVSKRNLQLDLQDVYRNLETLFPNTALS